MRLSAAASAICGQVNCSTPPALVQSLSYRNLSVMVMGLDDWPIERSVVVNEPRLLRAVTQELGDQVEKLLSPPATPDSIAHWSSPFEDTASVGAPVAPFSRWLVCPFCRLLAPIHSDLFELNLDPYRKDRSRYVHRVCKKPGKPPTAVPAKTKFIRGQKFF
jgi:hypothetical protein